MTTPTLNRRWYHLTPTRFFIGLLAVQVLLFLSEQFQWLPFNENKGWTVLIAVGVVIAAVLAMLLWGVVCLFSSTTISVRFPVVAGVRGDGECVAGVVCLGDAEGEEAKGGGGVLLELDGEVFYDHQLDKNGTWIVGLAEPTIPAWLRRSLGDNFFCDVTGVFCEGTDFDDNDMIYLKRLDDLRMVILSDTQVTDHGLASLVGLTNLRWLDLCDTRITDSGLAHLEHLTSLERLNLDGTQVTHEGIEAFHGKLPNCQITDLDGIRPVYGEP